MNDLIRSWKAARLSTGAEALGYPRENILVKAGKGPSGRPAPLPDTKMTDPEIVQAIVDRMSGEIRAVFEAFHLRLIRGQRCASSPHKVRALILGISDKTYRTRRDAGFEFVRQWLPRYLD